jgi:hypothetical protein
MTATADALLLPQQPHGQPPKSSDPEDAGEPQPPRACCPGGVQCVRVSMSMGARLPARQPCVHCPEGVGRRTTAKKSEGSETRAGLRRFSGVGGHGVSQGAQAKKPRVVRGSERLITRLSGFEGLVLAERVGFSRSAAHALDFRIPTRAPNSLWSGGFLSWSGGGFEPPSLA